MTWRNDSGNKTFTDWGDAFFQTYRDSRNAALVLSPIQAVLIDAANLLLFLLIMTSSPLRQKPRNWMLLSLAATNLINGTFSVPIFVDRMWHEEKRHGCLVHLTHDLFVIYLEDFIQTWTVLFLLLHYLVQLRAWPFPPAWFTSRCPPYLPRAAGRLCVFLPWLVALVVLLSVVVRVSNLQLWDEHYNLCQNLPLFNGGVLRGLTFSCFVSGTLILVLVVCVLVLRVPCGLRATWLAWARSPGQRNDARSSRESRSPLAPSDDPDRDIDPALVHVVVGLVTVLLVTAPLLEWETMYNVEMTVALVIRHMRLFMTFHFLGNLLPIAQAVLWMGLLPDLRLCLQARVRTLLVRVAAWCPGRSRATASRASCNLRPVAFTNHTTSDGSTVNDLELG